jgi:hypothetical protein
VVDMSREAISARLRAMARLLDERGFTIKGIDMSRAAVTRRLQSMAALSTMCLRLGKAAIVGQPRQDDRDLHTHLPRAKGPR